MRDDMDVFSRYIGNVNNPPPGYWRRGMIHENPSEAAEAFRKSLIDQGHDGIVLRNTAYDAQNVHGKKTEQYVPLKRGTVKSALTGDVLYSNPYGALPRQSKDDKE